MRERTESGGAIYELDADELRELEPDLIVTQAVCEVCAVSFDDVTDVAETMDPQPEVLSLDPTTLGEVIADIRAARRGRARAEDGRAADRRRWATGSTRSPPWWPTPRRSRRVARARVARPRSTSAATGCRR